MGKTKILDRNVKSLLIIIVDQIVQCREETRINWFGWNVMIDLIYFRNFIY